MTNEPAESVETGHSNPRPLYAPTNTWDDLFEPAERGAFDPRPYWREAGGTLPEPVHTYRLRAFMGDGDGWVIGRVAVKKNHRLSHYVDVVVPTDTLDVLRRWLVMPENDRVYFEAIEWEDGRVLVLASNSRIIGGVWLALLPDASTVPQLDEVTT